MSRLAGAIDGVIGVDPHRDTLAAAATDPVGGLLAQTSVSADAAGYRHLFDFAQAQVPGRRCWAVEGAGSYGAGLAAFLDARGERGSRSAGPSGHRGAPGPRATPWTPSAQHGRRSPTTIRLRRVAVATGKRCGCCWLPATAPARPSQRYQPVEGADHRGARGATRRAARAGHQTPGRALREAARPAGQVAGASHDRPGAALNRPAHPAPSRRGRRATGRAGPAGGRGRALAAGAAWRRPDQRRPGAGQLVACWPAAFGGRVCCPGWRQPDPGVLWAGHPASAEPFG
jgi:hypothetical protein